MKRKWWYLFLLMVSTRFVFINQGTIFSFGLDKITPINLIFILWLGLLLMPLFSEMEFLGVKLKKEVEKAKNEVKESLNDLKMQVVQLQVSNSVSNTIQIGGNTLASEEKLKELLKSVGISPKDLTKDELNINSSQKKMRLNLFICLKYD
jgi:hypothetical protein